MRRYMVAMSHDAVRLHWQFARMIADLPGMTPNARSRAAAYAAQWHNLATGQHPPPPSFDDARDTIAAVELADFYAPAAPPVEEITLRFTRRDGTQLTGPGTEFSAADVHALMRQVREAGRSIPRGLPNWVVDANIGDEAAFYDKQTGTLARVQKRAVDTPDSSPKVAGSASS